MAYFLTASFAASAAPLALSWRLRRQEQRPERQLSGRQPGQRPERQLSGLPEPGPERAREQEQEPEPEQVRACRHRRTDQLPAERQRGGSESWCSSSFEGKKLSSIQVWLALRAPRNPHWHSAAAVMPARILSASPGVREGDVTHCHSPATLAGSGGPAHSWISSKRSISSWAPAASWVPCAARIWS